MMDMDGVAGVAVGVIVGEEVLQAADANLIVVVLLFVHLTVMVIFAG
jgi:hypothetical protein